jgi:uncharacterized protein
MSKRAFWLPLAFAGLPVHAASFDCAKAAQLVESLICASSELSALDDSLAHAYRAALENAGDAEGLRATQRQWLKSRNACKNKACLMQKYATRLSALDSSTAPANRASALPAKVGDCADSVISGKATRFEDATPGEVGGEAVVQLENGLALYIVDVSVQPPPDNADRYMYTTSDFAVGDRVRLCLAALPEDCPPGDDRGKRYSVTNYKNRLSFDGVDAWHSCGGA